MDDNRETKTSTQSSKLHESIRPNENLCQHVCWKCNHAIEDGALYCEECGALQQKVLKCSRCGATIRPRADICEVCGEWLLKGQCKFCYAPIGDDETFCGECGNPSVGIRCTGCGKLSIFDFCPSCRIPLSTQAKQMALEREKDPIIKEIASIFQQISSINASTESPENEASLISSESESYDTQQVDQATKLKAYREDSKKINSELKTRNVSKAIFSSDQKKRISLLDEEVAKEEERRRIEEERRRQEEEQRRREEERRRQEEEQRRQEEECRRQEEERRKKEEEKKKERRLQEQLNAAMNRLRGKTFASNQEARRFFMNITAGLPEEIANKIVNRGLKWRCNAYDCVHDTPSECADPSRGGVWLIS